jgi:hypothetical protein
MNCLSCNFEYFGDLDSCERCGAPYSVADDAQPFEVNHCTACGARMAADSAACEQCGEPVLPDAEWVIGRCLNCGSEWGQEWQFCRHCGVFSANALVDEAASRPVALAAYAHTPGLLFAPLEGEPVTSRRCPECEAGLMAEANFCNQCGIRVRPTAVEPLDLFEAAEDGGESAARAFARGFDESLPPPSAEAATQARGSGVAVQAEPETERPSYRRRSRRLSRRARRRWRTAAFIFLLLITLLFVFLIATETTISELWEKLR